MPVKSYTVVPGGRVGGLVDEGVLSGGTVGIANELADPITTFEANAEMEADTVTALVADAADDAVGDDDLDTDAVAECDAVMEEDAAADTVTELVADAADDAVGDDDSDTDAVAERDAVMEEDAAADTVTELVADAAVEAEVDAVVEIVLEVDVVRELEAMLVGDAVEDRDEVLVVDATAVADTVRVVDGVAHTASLTPPHTLAYVAQTVQVRQMSAPVESANWPAGHTK